MSLYLYFLRRNQRLKKNNCYSIGQIVVLLFVMLSISSCGTFQVPKSELVNMGSGSGIVVGSFSVKIPYPTNEREVVLQKRLTKTKWQFIINRMKKSVFGREKFAELSYKVPVIIDGDKVFFVTKLPAGRYSISQFDRGGWHGDSLRYPIGVYFTVKDNQTTYIGDLLMKVSGPIGYLGVGRFQMIITDNQDDTIAQLKDEYGGSILDDVIPDIMVDYEHLPFKKVFGKSPKGMKPEDYISIFQGIDNEKKVKAARYLIAIRLFNPQVLAVVENKFKGGFNSNLEDDLHVQVMSWFCKFLGESGEAKYLATLKKVKNEALNEFIKEHATRYLEDKD